MKIAVMMDPLFKLNKAKDTSLALLRRAQLMGWECFCFTQKDVFCQDGRVYSEIYALHGLADKSVTLSAVACGISALSIFDIILMRQDPPFNMEYIYATYSLELAAREGVLVANSPRGLREVNEKFAQLMFPQCCPPTKVSCSMASLRAFWEEHRQVIFKPLDGMGGRSIFYVDSSGQNLSVILETMTNYEAVTIMAQRYIPEISVTGDKRILVINGEPVPYALARFPRQGETRGNLASGGIGKVVPITARDRWLCKEIAPFLRTNGLSFVGIDVIGDYLTEINVTSPTCLVEIEAETGLDISGDYLNYLCACR